jgi:hypothetical protein
MAKRRHFNHVILQTHSVRPYVIRNIGPKMQNDLVNSIKGLNIKVNRGPSDCYPEFKSRTLSAVEIRQLIDTQHIENARPSRP